MEQYHIFKLGLAVLFYAVYCSRPMLVNSLEVHSDKEKSSTNNKTNTDDYYVYYQGIQGKPGVDFPVYSHIPRTTFSCKDYKSGFYADLETDCQVFHICEEGKKISLLCPNGTLFHQSELTCEWWFKVNCTSSPSQYDSSAERLREAGIRNKASRRVTSKKPNNYGAVMRQEERSSVSARRNGKPLNPEIIDRANQNSNNDKVKFTVAHKTVRFNTNQYQKSTLKPTVFQISTNDNYHNKLSKSVRVTPTKQSLRIHRQKKVSTEHPPNQRRNFISSTTQVPYTSSLPKISYTSSNKNIEYEQYENKLSHNQIRETEPPFRIVINSVDSESDIKNPSLKDANPLESQYLSDHSTTTEKTILDNEKIHQLEQDKKVTNALSQSPNLDSKNLTKAIFEKIESNFYSNGKPWGQSQNFINSVRGEQKAQVPKLISQQTYSVKDSKHPKAFTSEEETQITEETASIFKNNFNLVQPNSNPKLDNPYPNHRQTYTDLRDPKYYNGKYITKSSSVTPQYFTTQPINNGKPFISNQLGTTIFARLNSNVPLYTSFREEPTTTLYSFHSTLNTNEQFDGTSIPLTTPEFTTEYPLSESISSVYSTTFAPATTQKINTIPNIPPLYRSSRNQFINNFESTTRQYTDHATIYGKFPKAPQTTPAVTQDNKIEIKFNTKSLVRNFKNNLKSTASTDYLTGLKFTKPISYNTVSSTISNLPNIETTKLVYNQPRPFETVTTSAKNSNTESLRPRETSYPFYKISTAYPFSSTTPHPTQPSHSRYVEDTQMYNDMINVLKTITNDVEDSNLSETPRPGLVVPPSAGPRTLHTLAVYFANALDEIVSVKGEYDRKKLSKPLNEIMEDKLTVLLTEMTKKDYKELFKNETDTTTEAKAETTTEAKTTTSTLEPKKVEEENDNDLEGQHSKNAIQSPKIRQLARVFTQALSAYLDDPATFRKVLEEVRPTEPAIVEETTTEIPNSDDDELLNFSDTDSKSSYPPIHPTVPSVGPTWGYILAYKNATENLKHYNLDVKNFLNQDNENLQIADSQSFISQFNNLNLSEKRATFQKNENGNDKFSVPSNHWTSSPDVTKLWQSTFAVNPEILNEHFYTTESSNLDLTTLVSTTVDISSTAITTVDFAAPTTIEPDVKTTETSREVTYELRSLPTYNLNSSQLEGILIDFMNSSKSNESNRFHRILQKLNTTEEEFLNKMREIEGNPLTRRLILLLVRECDNNESKEIETRSTAVETLLHSNVNLVTSQSTNNQIFARGINEGLSKKSNSHLDSLLDSRLNESDHDTRALYLLNSLYTIASKLGKK